MYSPSICDTCCLISVNFFFLGYLVQNKHLELEQYLENTLCTCKLGYEILAFKHTNSVVNAVL